MHCFPARIYYKNSDSVIRNLKGAVLSLRMTLLSSKPWAMVTQQHRQQHALTDMLKKEDLLVRLETLSHTGQP